jgi:hypothetical protein
MLLEITQKRQYFMFNGFLGGFGGLKIFGPMILILGGLLWNAERRLGNAHEEIGRLEVQVSQAVAANATVVQTLTDCRKVNAENKQQRIDADKRALAASDRITVLEAQLEEKLSEPYIPESTECRNLTDVLPTDFVDWLCIDGAGNCNSD